MSNLMAVAAAVASVLVPPADSPQLVDPPSEKLGVQLIAAAGSGCAPDTVTLAVTPGNTSLTLDYTGFTARVGGGAKPIEQRKNCQLVLQIEVPDGYSYAISKAEYRGYASLAPGASAAERAMIYTHGMPATNFNVHRLTGPIDDHWRWEVVAETKAMIWHPCGESRLLNINDEIRISAGTSDTSTTASLISKESTEGADAAYHLVWKRCLSD